MTELAQLRQMFTGSLRPIAETWRRVAQESLQLHGISVPCGSALLAITRLGEGVSQNHLAIELGIEAATLVRSVGQLELAGLIRREKSVEDRRVNSLWFTDKGRELSKQIHQELDELRKRMLKDVSYDDLQTTLRVFNSIEIFVNQASE